MITEDYVSIETAKLLKEKGYFNISDTLYKENGEFVRYKVGLNNKGFSATLGNFYEAPTLQIAMKWLRKEKKIICLPHIEPIEEKWFFYVVKLPQASDFPEYMSSVIYDTYEKACEAAIKYCLENLI